MSLYELLQDELIPVLQEGGVWLLADGSIEYSQPNNINKGYQLAELKKHIDGHIDTLSVVVAGERCVLIVDDEGLLKQLPFNYLATRIVWQEIPSYAETGAPIVGNALLVLDDMIQ